MSPVMNTMDDARLGTVQLDRVYHGDALIWEHEIEVVVTLNASKTAINAGEQITLTATLDKPKALTGTIQFRQGSPSGTIIGSASASPWTAVVSPSASGPIYAEYLGSDPYLPSMSAGLPITVAGTTELVLSASKTTVGPSESTKLTAVIAGVSTGTVQFRKDSPTGTILATVVDSPWEHTLVPNANTTYYATYLANPNHQAAISNSLFIDYVIPTSISLSASKTSVNQGEATVLTATVTGASSGTVRFRAGSPSGTIVATDTSAPWSASIIPTADTTYYAEYVASGDFGGSVSSGVAVAFSIPTSISLSASSNSVAQGGTVTLTAAVTGASTGTVEFRSGSPTGPVVGTDINSPWTAVVAPTADTTYYAVYIANGDYLRSESAGKAIDWYIPTSVSLAASASSINNGQSVTLTATVSGAPAGTVQFRAGSPTGTVVATDTASPWTATVSPLADTTYYATYVANGDYAASSSTGKAVEVKQLTTKTWSGNATWSACYDSSGDKRTDTSDLYYGYYSGTWGNQRSLIGFDVPDLSNAVDVTQVRLRFYNKHHYQNTGGKLTLAIHDYASEPATWSSGRVDTEEQTLSDMPKPGWVDEYLDGSCRNKIQAGSTGVGLGPGATTSTAYYGYAASASASNKPWMEIKWTEWV